MLITRKQKRTLNSWRGLYMISLPCSVCITQLVHYVIDYYVLTKKSRNRRPVPFFSLGISFLLSRCAVWSFLTFLLEHGPIEYVIVNMVQCTEKNSEQLSQIHVVWSLFESQASAVVQIHWEFCWESLTECINWSWHLFLGNSFLK